MSVAPVPARLSWGAAGSWWPPGGLPWAASHGLWSSWCLALWFLESRVQEGAAVG